MHRLVWFALITLLFAPVSSRAAGETSPHICSWQPPNSPYYQGDFGGHAREGNPEDCKLEIRPKPREAQAGQPPPQQDKCRCFRVRTSNKGLSLGRGAFGWAMSGILWLLDPTVQK